MVAVSSRYLSAPPNWLDDAFTSIQLAKQNTGGLIGMLDSARSGTTIKSFLKRSAHTANALSSIALNSTTDSTTLITQMAAANLQKKNDEQLQKTMADLQAAKNQVQKKNVLDPVIYFNDGSTIDTENNIMTRADGTQYDTLTGALYVDPASIVQLANGAYLDTKNNILTMGDGTKWDNITHLQITT